MGLTDYLKVTATAIAALACAAVVGFAVIGVVAVCMPQQTPFVLRYETERDACLKMSSRMQITPDEDVGAWLHRHGRLCQDFVDQ